MAREYVTRTRSTRSTQLVRKHGLCRRTRRFQGLISWGQAYYILQLGFDMLFHTLPVIGVLAIGRQGRPFLKQIARRH